MERLLIDHLKPKTKAKKIEMELKRFQMLNGILKKFVTDCLASSGERNIKKSLKKITHDSKQLHDWCG